MRSAPPARNAAGSITAARPRKPTSATCQPWLVISDCASGEASVRPSEPSAETEPIATMRLAGELVRAVTFIAMFEAVQESASPMHRPAPSVNTGAECAKRENSSPAA